MNIQTASEQELLTYGMQVLNLNPLPETIEKLLIYCREILLWNRKISLVHADFKQLIIRHILDCLAAFPLLQERKPASILDIGSGAGLPGIPLALFFPNTPVFLCESSEKKCGFLHNAVAVLGLKNVQVLCMPYNQVKLQCGCIIFRALTAVKNKTLSAMARLLLPDGFLAAYKGKRAVIEAECTALDPTQFSCELFPITVPLLDEERHLAVIKVKAFGEQKQKS